MQQTIQKEKKYVVINIGSTFITGMLSTKLASGMVQPVAIDRQPSGDNIKRGYIHNIDGTSKIIGLIIDNLSSHLQDNEQITSVYVGLECVSMRSRPYRSSLTLPGGGEIISSEHLQTLRDQVQDADYGKDEVVRILHPRFFVDGKPEAKPQGVRCQHIAAVYQVVTARKNILDNLRTTFIDKLGLAICDILITPVAEATTFLSRQEAMLGCAYINIGGGCTSVSLYRDRLLDGLYILPMGGKDVTKDLETLSLVEHYAEQVKLSKAAMDVDIDRNESLTIEGMNVKLLEVNRTVLARMVEILLNVTNIVGEATEGDQSKITSWVFSGGGAQLSGFIGCVEDTILQPVRLGGIHPEFVAGAVTDAERANFASELALSYLTSKDCIELTYQAIDTLTEDPIEEEVVEEEPTADLLIGSDEPDGTLDLDEDEEPEPDKEPIERQIQGSKGRSKENRWLKQAKGFLGGLLDKVNRVDEDEYDD